MDQETLAERLAFTESIARSAGGVALEIFHEADLGVQRKADGSPVTRADAAAERHLRERIEATYPDDAILGEEEEDRPGTSGFRWILDPIDGTVSFVQRVPLWCTLVGLEHDGEAVAGTCWMPCLDEGVSGAKGLGARWHRSRGDVVPARVSDVDDLAEATVLTTSHDGWVVTGKRPRYERLFAACRQERGWSDGYAMLLVATGRAEVCIEPQMHVWDNAPFLPILEEAGGTFTDLQGNRTIGEDEALATNGRVLGATLELLRT